MSPHDIFDRDITSTEEFEMQLAERIQVGADNAKRQGYFQGLFITNEVEQERDTNQRRINATLRRLLKRNLGILALNETESLVDAKNEYYWESHEKKNLFLRKSGSMPLSQAIALSLVKQHFSELFTEVQSQELGFMFDEAEKNLRGYHQRHDREQPVAYRPLSTDWIKTSQIDPQIYQFIVEAIEEEQVIQASYESIQANVPSRIVFSPHQIRMQFMRVYVVGYVHNSIPSPGITKPGIYRHLDVSRFNNVEIDRTGIAYERKHQPEEPFPFVAYIHPWVKNAMERLKCSEDQKIQSYSELDEKERELMDQCITHALPQQPWYKVTATIKLTSKFLDQQDDWDAWFFVNALGIYGADIIVTEPYQVVNEIRRRVNDNANAYARLEQNNYI